MVFAPFWSENRYRCRPFWSGIEYSLRRNHVCVPMCSSFQFQMNKKESVIRMDFKKSFCCCFNFSNVDIISGLCKHVMLRFVTTTRSENQCEKWHFWSKMGSGFWEPGWIPGGGDSAYERGGDFRRKLWIKPGRPIWAWPKLFLTPKKRPCWNTDNTHIFIFFHVQP